MNEQIDEQLLLPLNTLLQMGKYRVDRYLSSGGFGNTYVITNLQFEEQFAMKEFFMKGINERNEDNTTISVSNKTNRPQFEQQREKFKKEARRLRKLHNRHIVQVHDLFEENGTTYYVMDFVDGESLSNRLKRTKKPFNEQEALSYFSQALDALETVHEKGIWHLDLKPANIMVDRTGNVVLIDFGASKQMSSSEGYTTTTTAMCYTQGYAPAEQIDQNMKLIGPWTDLYALGATLYNLVTCNEPPSVSEMLGADAFSFPKSVSEKTMSLIRWMMNPNREQRPQSVEEVKLFINGQDKKSHLTNEETILPSREKKPIPSPWWKTIMLNAKGLKLGIVTLAILLGLGILIGSIRSCGKVTPSDEYIDSIAEVVDSVVDSMVVDSVSTAWEMTYDSGLGTCIYTGPLDEYGIPDGIGEAKFKDGRFYRGPFIHGVFEGEDAYFKYENGDTFEGSFVKDGFSKGKYTIKEDGSYFIGSFKNGQPDKGRWYDGKRSTQNKQKEQELDEKERQKELYKKERQNIEDALGKAVKDSKVKFGLG